MAKQAGQMSDEPTSDELASSAVERGVAKTIGRPLGALAGVLGFGMAIASFGSGEHAAGVGWLTLGAFGFAMMAVGNAAADSAA